MEGAIYASEESFDPAGAFGARIKAAGGRGAETTFTLFNKQFSKNIAAIKILGENPSWMQVSYAGARGRFEKTIDLGFNASKKSHEYIIRRTKGPSPTIIWYVDGRAVNVEDGSFQPLPNYKVNIGVAGPQCEWIKYAPEP